MNVKRFLLFLTALVMLMGAFSYQYEEVPAVKGMETFEITCFYGTHDTAMTNEDFYQKIAECGFTSVPLENGTLERNKLALKLMDSRITTLFNQAMPCHAGDH